MDLHFTDFLMVFGVIFVVLGALIAGILIIGDPDNSVRCFAACEMVSKDQVACIVHDFSPNECKLGFRVWY